MQQFLKNVLDSYFIKDEVLNEQMFNELVLYVYSLESKDSDLYMLSKILPEESLLKLIAYYDGDILKLPSREEYKTCLLTALCFWLKTFKGYTWFEIKEFLDIPENNKDLLSSISIGGKINKLRDNLGKDLLNILEKTDEKQFVDLYKKMRDINI
jgi:hypothetical protein